MSCSSFRPGARRASCFSAIGLVARKLAGVLRAALFLAILVAVALFGWLRSAEARLFENLRGFGSELLAWQGAHPDSAPRQLTLNGVELGLITLSSKESIGRTLDRFHALCRRQGGILLPKGLPPGLGSVADATFRHESEHEGVLVCLDTGHSLSPGELAERLRRFDQTGDLSSLGELRYVLARREGGSTTTLVIWTQGAARLLGMFPKNGDAPGYEPKDVPRPEGSRRLLSAREHGLPYALRIYTSENPPHAVYGWYENALKAKGWSVKTGERVLEARRGTRVLVVQVIASANAGALVSVAELA